MVGVRRGDGVLSIDRQVSWTKNFPKVGSNTRGFFFEKACCSSCTWISAEWAPGIAGFGASAGADSSSG